MAIRVVAEVVGGQNDIKETGTAAINDRGEWRVKLVRRKTDQDDQSWEIAGLGNSYAEARNAALADAQYANAWRELMAKLDDEVFEAD